MKAKTKYISKLLCLPVDRQVVTQV